jgi:acyl-homoserine-lactone acylase
MPTVENPDSGFVQNANEPPWSYTSPVATGVTDPDTYCRYIDSRPPLMQYRPQASFRMMTENTNIDYERFLELKMSTLKEASNHVLDDLVAAVDEFAPDDAELQARTRTRTP